MSELFLRTLAGISPFLVAFMEDKFNISFLTLLPVTFKKFNVLLEWKLADLLLCKLLWFLNVSSIFSSYSHWLILFVFRFMCLVLVIYVKSLFMKVAIFPSSLPISFPSTGKMSFDFKPSFEKNGLTYFKNVFLSDNFLTFRLLKYFSFVWLNNFR